ncbi:unnamed protein product [Caenorhabditis brenneri]
MAFEPQHGWPLDTDIEPFTIQHRWVNSNDVLSNFYSRHGVTEQHGPFAWRIFWDRDGANFVYGLECLKNHEEYSIETTTEGILSSVGERTSMTRYHLFDSSSFVEATSWDDFHKLLNKDGEIIITMRVDTRKVLWNQDIERNFLHVERMGKNCHIKRFYIEVKVNTDDPVDEDTDLLGHLTYVSMQDVMGVASGATKLDDMNLVSILLTTTQLKIPATEKNNVLEKCEQFLRTSSKKPKFMRLDIAKKFKMTALETHLNRFEGAEMCIINTDALNCPVCFEIFDGVPQSYPCGHTVCFSCSESLKGHDEVLWLRCPVCRELADSTVKNYALINVLASLDVIPSKEKVLQKVYDSTVSINASIKYNQLRKDNAKKVRKITDLTAKINDMKCLLGEKKNQNYVPIEQLLQAEEEYQRKHNEAVRGVEEQNELLRHGTSELREELAKAKHEIKLITEANKAQEKVHQENMYTKNMCLYFTLSLLFCFVMYFGYINM